MTDPERIDERRRVLAMSIETADAASLAYIEKVRSGQKMNVSSRAYVKRLVDEENDWRASLGLERVEP